jgi:hypothetical protein
MALLVLMVNRVKGDSARERPATTQVLGPAPVTAPQSASIDLVRGVAKRDLAGAGARLGACEGPRVRCTHVPLAHLAFGGRAASGMLTGLANGLPTGDCRALVLGSSNTLALLSSDADELWRGLGDQSRSGARTSSLRYESIRDMIRYVTTMLGGPAWAACTPPPAGAT